MFVDALIKLLTVANSEVALLQHSRCDSAQRVPRTSQHVRKSRETRGGGWVGGDPWLTRRQSTSLLAGNRRPRLNLCHSADVNEVQAKNVYVSLSVLRTCYFVDTR